MTIEGNFNPNTDRTSGSGVLLCPDLYLTSSSSSSEGQAYFYMYGGEIRDNYTAGSGGGVNAYGYTTSGDRAHKTYFYMRGGVIEGNYANAKSTVGGGGVSVFGSVYAANGTYFCMNGGATIRDNVCDGPGAGVYVHSVCECSIAGTITGNRSFGNSDGTAGLCCINIDGVTSASTNQENLLSVITIEGSAFIYGNYSNGKKSNFGELIDRDVIIDYAYITLGSLAEGARIGVTPFVDTVASRVAPDLALYNPLQITVADDPGKASSYLKYFYSDDSAYNVGVGSDDSNSTTHINFVAK